MPTVRPRHQVTETEQIAQALDAAADAWPEHRGNRGKLLVKLVERGHAELASERQNAMTARREAIQRVGGTLTGVYGNGYLDELRSEWPD